MAFLESASSGDVRSQRCRKFASLIAKIVQLAFVMRRRPNPDSEANIRRIDTKARANSNKRLCAVCREESLSDLSKRAATAAVFPTIDFPAFDESWRKVFWSCRDPTIDDLLRKKRASFNLCPVRK